jgi:hypothetical protein
MLNIRAFGIAAGVLWGGVLFLMTLLVVIQNDGGDQLIKLNKVYLGYRISFAGSLLGLGYGFVSAFMGGALFAWIYNKLNRRVSAN